MAKTISEKRFINHEFKEAESMLRRMAKNGNPRGMYCMGEMLIQKALFDGDEASRLEGLSYLLTGARAEDPLCFMAYVRHDNGLLLESVEESERKGLRELFNEWADDLEPVFKKLKRMAEKGDVLAMLELAAAYASGFGTDPDMKEAAAWLKKSADDGYWNAMLRYAGLLMREGTDESRKAGFEYIKKAAAAGDGMGEIRLGNCFHYGLGCEKSFTNARMCYDRACRRGSVYAALAMAKLYDDPSFMERNDMEAAIWTEKAANMGSTDAMCVMGDRFYYGASVERNYNKAQAWYKKAASMRSSRALFALGRMAILDKDYDEGYNFMRQAAHANWPEGWMIMGLMQMEGLGVKKNHKKGKKLLEDAARAGVVEARQILKNPKRNTGIVNLLRNM